MFDDVSRNGKEKEPAWEYAEMALIDWLRSKIKKTRRGANFTNDEIDVKLDEESENIAVAFQEKYFHCSPERAKENLERYKPKAILSYGHAKLVLLLILGGIGLWIAAIILMTGAEPYEYGQTHPYYLLVALLIAVALLIPIAAVATARERAEARASKQYGNTMETLEAYCDIQQKTPFQNLGVKGLAAAAALVVAVCVGAYMLNGPVGQNRRVIDIVSRYTWYIPEASLDEVTLRNGQLTDEGRSLIDSSMDSFEAGSQEALNLAVYAQMKTKNGYPEDAVRQRLIRQIEAMDVTKRYDSNTLQTLMAVAPWSREMLYERCQGSDDYHVASILKTIAESSGDMPLTDRLAWAVGIDHSSYTSLEFFSASLTAADLPELGSLLTQITDQEQRSLCVQALADQPNQPEDIVPVLHQLRQQGQSLEELFPHGVKLNLDLNSLNGTRELPAGEVSPSDGPYLIVSRTEQDVEGKQLNKLPDDDYSCHDKSDPATFDVRVGTAWMDQLSPDLFPASYADCRWLAVMDLQYIYDGCITNVKDYATGKEETDEHYFPVYGNLSRLILVEREGLAPRYLVDSLSVDANKDQTVMRWTNTSMGTSVSKYYAAPRFDSDWSNQAFRQLVDSLNAENGRDL